MRSADECLYAFESDGFSTRTLSIPVCTQLQPHIELATVRTGDSLNDDEAEDSDNDTGAD